MVVGKYLFEFHLLFTAKLEENDEKSKFDQNFQILDYFWHQVSNFWAKIHLLLDGGWTTKSPADGNIGNGLFQKI